MLSPPLEEFHVVEENVLAAVEEEAAPFDVEETIAVIEKLPIVEEPVLAAVEEEAAPVVAIDEEIAEKFPIAKELTQVSAEEESATLDIEEPVSIVQAQGSPPPAR